MRRLSKKTLAECISVANSVLSETDPIFDVLLRVPTLSHLSNEILTEYSSCRKLPQEKLGRLINELEAVTNALKALSDSTGTNDSDISESQ
jgi:hypothetical protein